MKYLAFSPVSGSETCFSALRESKYNYDCAITVYSRPHITDFHGPVPAVLSVFQMVWNGNFKTSS